ncbi:acetate--CoA ligase family protein [Kribbella sp. NPDC050820]|uniref:acetate--CoA ligase family protein n=1 Tax=Kribbella sp. NPDC050820 TaxID=3155408 RepID=UPI0033E19C80
MKEPQTVSNNDLSALFRPKSVAVVGVSSSESYTRLWSRQTLENFRLFGYSGKVAAVNPKYQEVQGFPCYPSIKSMPFVPDAVVILRNAASTVSMIEEAAEVGVRAAVTFATGFAEVGAEGAAAQARIANVARASGMAVVGPNCSGLINWVDRVPLHLGAAELRGPGCVALIAHGGGPKTSLFGNKRGVRWSHVVTCGNEAVTGSADFLRYFIDDPQVRVVCAFIETIRDPERFFFECERARAAGKPVIILKSGRSEAARKMATAHTGALAAPYRLYRELFRRHGVVQVDSFDELLASAITMQVKRPPGEGRLAAVHPSAGLLELILDESAKYPSLSYPDFEQHTANTLQGLVPGYRGRSNPVDIGNSLANLRDSNPKILAAAGHDPNVDIVVAHYDPNQLGGGYSIEHELTADSAVRAAAATNKLVTLVTPLDGSTPPETVENFLDKNVVVLGIHEAFRALDRAVIWTRPVPPIADEAPIEKAGMAKRIREFGGKPFAGKPALDFLGDAGISVVESRFVDSVNAAVGAAEELGYPVVAKIGDTGALHRTELSGVMVNLRNAQEVAAAAEKLFASDAHILIIQPYVRDGIEMILGLQTDDVLGTFVLVGQGGIWTEVMDDAALRPAGLRVGEPEQMLAELRVQRILKGVRGAAALDTQALADAVRRLDTIARTLGDQLHSIDINPLFVRKQGVVAVDALVVPRPT